MVDIKVFFLLIIAFGLVKSNRVPPGFLATVKVFHPNGFEVSIPDSPNVTLFAFHGKLNEEFDGWEAGRWSSDITKPRNGRWTFKDKNTELKIGDTLYYWTTINFNGVGYHEQDSAYVVHQYDNSPESSVNPTTSAPITSRPTTTVKPIDVFHFPEDTTTVPIPQGCVASITTVNGQPTCKGQLLFDEQFNSQLDKQKWSHEVRIPIDTEDAEFVSYQTDSFNSFLESGNLVIRPSLLTRNPEFTEESIFEGTLDLKSSCTATRNVQKECIRKADAFFILPPVSSAKINTKKSFKFRYGKVEIKAKVPKGDWIFPQLNLEPAELIYGSDYFASGLLRIGMVRGNEVLLTSEHQSIGGEWLCGGAVLTAGSQFRDTWMKCTMGDKLWSDDFHTYGLEWTDEAITLSVDGKTYGEPLSNNLKRSAHSRNIVHSSSWKSENKLSPFDQEFYISIGVGVAGISDFPDQSKSGTKDILKPWPNTSPKGERLFYSGVENWYKTWSDEHSKLQVDYVKVWAV